jgi:acyl-CoA thioester hydrolase
MNQVKIELPNEFPYSTSIPVRITDLNYGGHVGNDTVLTLFHEARMQFLAHYGVSEMNFGGTSLIMRNVLIEFRKEIFYGDSIKVHVALSNFSKASFDLFYKMVKGNDEMIVATGKTGMVCYNYELKKVVSVPVEMLNKFG